MTSPSLTSQRRRRLAHRGFFGTIGKDIQRRSISDVEFMRLTDPSEIASNLDSFDVNKTDTLPPISIHQDFPLFDEKVTCDGKTLSVKADVDASTNAVVSIGVAASGTVVPPKLSEFALFAGAYRHVT